MPSSPASPPSPSAAPSAPPSAPPFPPLPPRTFFTHVARPLLARLLSPFDQILSTRGFSLATLAAAPPDDRALPHALHALLDAAHSSSPSPDPDDAPALAPLFERLAAVARVASPAGREALIKLDTARLLPPRLGPEDLAATACLDFPDLFAQVRVASASDAVKGFVLFQACAGSEPSFAPPAIEATASYLGQWFEERHRTAVCDIYVRRRDGEVHFEIAHGKTPVTHELIDEALAIKVVTQVSTQRSYAVYYSPPASSRCTRSSSSKRESERASGAGAARGRDYFAKSTSLLDMARLVDLDAALLPDPELGVTKVELRWIDVTAADGSGGSYWPAKVGDVRRSSQNTLLRAALGMEDARVTYLKFAIDLAGVKRTQLVEIFGLRNQLVYDRRDAGVERTLLAWLTRRGVWLGGRRDVAGDEPALEAEASA